MNCFKPLHTHTHTHTHICLFCFVLFCFCFLGPHPRHMEDPRLGVQSELQLLATATATATQDPSRICDPHHSSWQCQILNPLSKPRDRTCNLRIPSGIRFCCVTGTPSSFSLTCSIFSLPVASSLFTLSPPLASTLCFNKTVLFPDFFFSFSSSYSSSNPILCFW